MIPIQDAREFSASKQQNGIGIGEPGAPMYTLDGQSQHGVVAFKPSHYTRGNDGAPSDVVPPLSADADKGDQEPVVLAFDCKRDGHDATENITPTLRAGMHDKGNANGGVMPAVVTFVPEVTGALTSGGHPGSYNGQAAYSDQLLANSGRVRRLTPLESERLMGWPDGWTAQGEDANGVGGPLADSPRYRMCGNGVVRPVASWIGRRIHAWLTELGPPEPGP